ncbi:MAG: hypothetical protein LBU99_07065 [Spirochaetaceae bacterium]|jgi:hypothetical protein|nr:hypothetical protein [Spirochaetaceae bacterium]
MVRLLCLLTGYRHWGKSWTLRETILGYPKHSVKINHVSVRKKTSSNGDNLEDLLDFIKKNYLYIIIAFSCDACDSPSDVIDTLKAEGYEIYFFVLKHCYKNPAMTISSSEMSMMSMHGTVEEEPRSGIDSSVRAAAFQTFLQKHIP